MLHAYRDNPNYENGGNYRHSLAGTVVSGFLYIFSPGVIKFAVIRKAFQFLFPAS
jgi:hypothetical protein